MQDYPWFKNYPEGIPQEINPDAYDNLSDFFEVSVKKYTGLIAYENMGKSITFDELDQMTQSFASYLQNDLGLQKGDRVAIQMPNLLQLPIALFGCLRAGMVVVNTNPLYTAREMEHQFKDTGAKAVVILANFAHNLEKIIGNTDIKHVIITEIGDLLGGIKGLVVNFVVKNVRKMVPSYKISGAIKYNDVLKKGKPAKYNRPAIKNEEIAFLQYTGGTTGVSKGAMLSHRNIIANMEQISAWMLPKLEERKETMITALPMYHIFALTVNCLAMFKIGAKNVLITNPRDLPTFIKELKKHPFTVMTGVNTLFKGLLNNPEFSSVDFSHFKIAVGGGMAVQDIVAKRWKETTGVALVEGYGLSETSPVLTCNPIDETERIGTIGLPLPSTEIILLNDEGKPVPDGTPGEICAKGPQVMNRYWNRKEETENVFYNGYFKTGDMGVTDDSGFFKIVDRKKEMINVSGFNVYPNEIENIVAAHHKVLEVGAIGISDPKSNEVVKIFVVKKDDSLTQEEIIAYCKENMTGYKVPKVVEFRDELPKSNVGKILRRLLKESEEKASQTA
ncbi:MAG TPA: long-chain-fatty-acid--CoA ligase [Cytophagales bacterium]|mgnify:FL=1|jgi:long-chain acyl-CoA synthetase|nr:long-chain-fatty-acid--CoA ligase [Cytophagales bacterium]